VTTYLDPCPACGRRPNARLRKWLADRAVEAEAIEPLLALVRAAQELMAPFDDRDRLPTDIQRLRETLNRLPADILARSRHEGGAEE